jgi:hypothetical protein
MSGAASRLFTDPVEQRLLDGPSQDVALLEPATMFWQAVYRCGCPPSSATLETSSVAPRSVDWPARPAIPSGVAALAILGSLRFRWCHSLYHSGRSTDPAAAKRGMSPGSILGPAEHWLENRRALLVGSNYNQTCWRGLMRQMHCRFAVGVMATVLCIAISVPDSHH